MLIRRCLISLHLFMALLLGLGFSGCDKKRSEATVIAKEHIDAAEIKPSPTPKASGDETKDAAPDNEPVYREMAPDEIDVDGIVMKKEVRGTSKDPRATTDEQWRIRVEIAAARQSQVIRTDRAHYDKLKIGDRIKVRYRQGQYTGKVWFADIED
jgi:hypothetical protein